MKTYIKYSGFLLALVAISATGIAQNSPGGERGKSTVGKKGITLTVAEIMKTPGTFDSKGVLGKVRKNNEEEAERDFLPSDPAAPAVSQWPPAKPVTGTGGKYEYRPFTPQTIGTQWTGSQAGNLVPPDSFGSVGPTQVMVTTNSQVKVYDKSGNLGGLNVTLDSFFTSVRNGGTSDPRVTFDRLSNKWYVCCISVSSPFRILLAVSSGPTITSSSSFTFFFVNRGTTLPDYPSLGVDANGIYIGENSFLNGASFTGCNVSVIQKSSVQGGGPIFSTLFNVVSGSGEGPFAPRGVDNDDPAPANGYIVGVSNSAFSRLVVRKVTGASTTTPTMGANQLITVPTTANPITPVPSNGQSIDALDDRIFHAQMHLNRKTGARSLWCAHNVRMNSAGVGSSGGDRNGARWYEVNIAAGSPALVQSGTANDTATSGFDHFIIPSCIISGQGHMAISFNMTRSGQFIRVGAAGRLAGDTAGSTQLPATLAFTSANAYTIGATRWGDYSATVVDPADDQTIWTFQEISVGTNWGVRVIKLVAPAPSVVASVSPNTLTPGQNANLTIDGTGAAGSEYYDTASGFNRLACSFNSDITVNTVTFSHANPQQIVVNVTVSGGASAGPRNLTITNPDGQSVVSNGAVTISGGPTSETLAPTSEQIVLGTQASGGNLASWAANDGNNRKVCKFLVPFQGSPFIRLNLNYTTTKPAPTAISFDVKVGVDPSAVQQITLKMQNKVNSTFVNTSVVGVPTATGVTYNGVPSGTLSDYVGGGGAMTGQIEILAVGLQTSSFPCLEFDSGLMVVTG